MQDKNGKPMDRPFPTPRDPADKYKVTIVPQEEQYTVESDPNSNRPIVKKKEKKV